jgi:hypothetical protein
MLASAEAAALRFGKLVEPLDFYTELVGALKNSQPTWTDTSSASSKSTLD